MTKSKRFAGRCAGVVLPVFILPVMLWHCSTSRISGGGSDTEVCGRIVTTTGAAAQGAIVTLIDTGYDPGFDGALPANSYDTADLQGNYRFEHCRAGGYNVWAQSISGDERILVSGIAAVDEQATTVDDAVLRPAATLTLLLPDTLASVKGRVSVPGTLLSAETSGQTEIVEMCAVPQGTLTSIRFRSSPSQPPLVLYTDVAIDSAGPFTLNPYSSWQHEAAITFNTTPAGANVDETILDFPVLIRLTGADIDFSQARREGEDLRFVRNDYSPVPFEIEYWDSSTASAVIWVRIDTLRGNSSMQGVRMLWGNAAAKKSSRSASVFDTAAGFQGVWHLGESGPASKNDATANGFTATPVELTGSSDVAGCIGRALDVDGSSQCAAVLDARNSRLDVQAESCYTVSAWVYLRNTQRDNRVIVSKGSAQYGLRANERNQWEFYGGLPGYGVDTTTTCNATINVWTLLTGVRIGMKQFLYVNGTAVDSTPSAAGVDPGISDNYYDLVIGRQSDDESQGFDGMIDEVRVENRSRTAAWVRLCHESQRIGQRFVFIQTVR